jgi:hypothetical protein
MDETKLIELITSLGEALRSDMASSIETLNKKCDALSEAIEKKNTDGARKFGEAEQVAADDERAGHRTVVNNEMRSDAVGRSEFAALASSVSALAKRNSRPMADLNAFADAQAKADSVMRVHGESAEPPMSGEDIVAYQIRLARKMQPHSKTWKSVDLQLIQADRQAFGIALDGIRADALQAGLNPVHLKPFEHRKIVKESPGGHKITEFVGNGTYIAQMSRPVRHVKFIGTRGTAHY